MYMSNHPDTLVAYVKYWGKVKETVVSAQMTSIDSEVRVSCSLPLLELSPIARVTWPSV